MECLGVGIMECVGLGIVECVGLGFVEWVGLGIVEWVGLEIVECIGWELWNVLGWELWNSWVGNSKHFSGRNPKIPKFPSGHPLECIGLGMGVQDHFISHFSWERRSYRRNF